MGNQTANRVAILSCSDTYEPPSSTCSMQAIAICRAAVRHRVGIAILRQTPRFTHDPQPFHVLRFTFNKDLVLTLPIGCTKSKIRSDEWMYERRMVFAL